jgi:hypothetical protein
VDIGTLDEECVFLPGVFVHGTQVRKVGSAPLVFPDQFGSPCVQ